MLSSSTCLRGHSFTVERGAEDLDREAWGSFHLQLGRILGNSANHGLMIFIATQIPFRIGGETSRLGGKAGRRKQSRVGHPSVRGPRQVN